MNGTGDMARNPRIKGDAAASRQKQDKGDVTPNKKSRRPETRNVIIGDILLGCRDRNEVEDEEGRQQERERGRIIDARAITGNKDDRNDADTERGNRGTTETER